MEKCQIAIAGLGVVGAETARHLIENCDELSQKTGKNISLVASVQGQKANRGFDISFGVV